MKKYELYMRPDPDWDESRDFVISSVESAVSFLRQNLCIQNRDREIFWVLAVNAKGGVIGYNEAAVGDLSSTISHPREIFKFLIMANAAAFLVAHNHPSDIPEPSETDRDVTKILGANAAMMRIQMLDHIIVTQTGYFSFRESESSLLCQ